MSERRIDIENIVVDYIGPGPATICADVFITAPDCNPTLVEIHLVAHTTGGAVEDLEDPHAWLMELLRRSFNETSLQAAHKPLDGE